MSIMKEAEEILLPFLRLFVTRMDKGLKKGIEEAVEGRKNLTECFSDKLHQLLKYAFSICYDKQKYAIEVRVYGKTISEKCKAGR